MKTTSHENLESPDLHMSNIIFKGNHCSMQKGIPEAQEIHSGLDSA